MFASLEKFTILQFLPDMIKQLVHFFVLSFVAAIFVTSPAWSRADENTVLTISETEFGSKKSKSKISFACGAKNGRLLFEGPRFKNPLDPDEKRTSVASYVLDGTTYKLETPKGAFTHVSGAWLSPDEKHYYLLTEKSDPADDSADLKKVVIEGITTNINIGQLVVDGNVVEDDIVLSEELNGIPASSSILWEQCRTSHGSDWQTAKLIFCLH